MSEGCISGCWGWMWGGEFEVVGGWYGCTNSWAALMQHTHCIVYSICIAHVHVHTHEHTHTQTHTHTRTNTQTHEHTQVGVVQTAYANGASTRYITQQLGLQVVCAKTGASRVSVFC